MARKTPRHPSQSLAPKDGLPRFLAFLAFLPTTPLTALIVLTQVQAHGLRYVSSLGSPWLLPVFSPWIYLVGAGCGLALAVLALGRRVLRPGALLFAPFLAALLSLALGPLYPPYKGWLWLRPLARSPELRQVAVDGLVWGLASFLVLPALAALLFRLSRSGPVAEVAHGSSRLATYDEVKAAGLLGGRGTVLGAWPEGGRREPLTDDSEDHVLLLMPPGSGKTTGPILSTLLTDLSPAFIVDPKGELWEHSAGWRASHKHRCRLFNPTSSEAMHTWNFLQEIDRGPSEVSEVGTLVENLVSPAAGSQSDSHWTQSARTLLRGLVLHALYADSAPTMDRVRDLLNDPAQGQKALFQSLLTYEHDRHHQHGWRAPSSGEPTRTHPEVARIARAMLETPDKERGSIISTLQRYLDLWGNPVVARNTATSNFRLDEMLDPSKRTSLYVSMPYGDLDRLAPLIRVMLALLTRRLEHSGKESRRILFLLDEFASLGRIPILEQMLAFFRGFGVKAHIVVQDLAQLHRLYSLNESISGNCQIHVAAATQSAVTRQRLSTLSGEATVRYERHSHSGGRLAMKGRTTVQPTEVRRRLFTEGELGTLPKDQLLILKAGMQPILARKFLYFEHRELRRRAAIKTPVMAKRSSQGRKEKHRDPETPDLPPVPERSLAEREAETELSR